MRIAPLADVKAKLSAYLEECKADGPIIITRNGRAVAVLLAPVDDNDLESLILTRSPRFQALLAKSRQSIKAGKGLSRKDFGQAVTERNKKVGKARRLSAAKVD
jgi:prevent-host-death family protein